MNTSLVSPWIDYFRSLEALFEKDPDVRVLYINADEADEDGETYKNPKVEIYVNGADKCDALTAILPSSVVFGNMTLEIEVIPSNSLKNDKISLFRLAFYGNEAVSEIVNFQSIIGDLNYIVFKKEVVQYKNDDIGDYHNVKSTLYQDIAEKVFSNGHDGVFFCTDVE